MKAERKRVRKERRYIYVTRNQVIYPWTGWRVGNTAWRTAPTFAKYGDDLWVGVKG